MAPKIIKIQLEISTAWADENPELYREELAGFFDSHSDYDIEINSDREGFIVLIATKEK